MKNLHQFRQQETSHRFVFLRMGPHPHITTTGTEVDNEQKTEDVIADLREKYQNLVIKNRITAEKGKEIENQLKKLEKAKGEELKRAQRDLLNDLNRIQGNNGESTTGSNEINDVITGRDTASTHADETKPPESLKSIRKAKDLIGKNVALNAELSSNVKVKPDFVYGNIIGGGHVAGNPTTGEGNVSIIQVLDGDGKIVGNVVVDNKGKGLSEYVRAEKKS